MLEEEKPKTEIVEVEDLTEIDIDAVFLEEGIVEWVINTATGLADEIIKNQDVNTKEGLEECSRNAMKFSKLKVKIDTHGKDMIAGKKEVVKKFNSKLKYFRDEMDKIRDEVKRPVTEAKNRELRVESTLEGINTLMYPYKANGDFYSLDELKANLTTLKSVGEKDEPWFLLDSRISNIKATALKSVETLIEARIENEAKEEQRKKDELELAKLRKEKEERERKEEIAAAEERGRKSQFQKMAESAVPGSLFEALSEPGRKAGDPQAPANPLDQECVVFFAVAKDVFQLVVEITFANYDSGPTTIASEINKMLFKSGVRR